MKNNKWLKLIAIIISASFFIGCGGGSSQYTKTTEASGSKTIDTTTFDENTGAVIKDTTLDINSTQTTVTIPEGTVFTDNESNPITQPPVVKVKVAKNRVNTKAELQVISTNGEKIIPTEPVKVSVPVPNGVKPGDTVKVEVPSSSKNGNIEKLILIVVDKDGKVSVMVAPDIFKDRTVILIVVEAPEASTN
jgi:hypothetical protein